MVMPAPGAAPPPYYPPRRRGNGCLWGCLIVILLMFLPFLLAGGYGAWFWTEGYKRDPVLRVAGEMLRRDGMAQMAMGDGAVITGVDGNYFSWMPGGSDSATVFSLEGAKGRGRLAVTAHTTAAGPRLDSAILTGPDGRRYDLLHHQVLPDDSTAPPDTSI
jgi:hypothetical protein